MRLFLVLLLTSSVTLAQPLTETQKLASLGKVWGFLKYYHPSVATGKYDWDAQLIRLIPAVQQTRNREQLSALYLAWLDSLGRVESCRKCKSDLLPRNQRNVDLAFLNDSIIVTKALQTQLIYLKNNRNQGDNFYVQQVKQVGNTSYENEKLYADMTLPEESYRLLALFRYWNIIHYFFPYKYAIDGNWNDVLTDLIPVFQQANTEQNYQNALYRLVARIQDSHGFITTTNKTRCMRCDLGKLWLPFELKLINNKAIITRFYNDSLAVPHPLSVGTIISHIDGETIQTRIERIKPYVSASNEGAFLRDVHGLIGVGSEQEATLTVEQSGKNITMSVFRSPYRVLGKETFRSINARYPVSKWLNDSIGYINLGHLATKQVDSVMKPFLSARAITFDLRNYPKGTYWLVGHYLIDKPQPFVSFTMPNLFVPGVFQQAATINVPQPGRKQLYRGKTIVLINEDTQSHAEFTAMAFRTVSNVTFIGSPTAGADGNISWVPLPGGYRTAFSGIGVYYPDGRETQRIGIVPDITVQPTPEGIRAGRDEVLERAIDLILEK